MKVDVNRPLFQPFFPIKKKKKSSFFSFFLSYLIWGVIVVDQQDLDSKCQIKDYIEEV